MVPGQIFTPQNRVYSTDARAVLNPISLYGNLTSYSELTKTASYKGKSVSFNLSNITLVHYSIEAQTDNYYWQNINDAIGSLLYQFSNGKFYALQCHLVFGSVTNDYPGIENFYVAEQRHQISGRDIVTVSAGITGYLVDYYPLWGVLYYQAAKVSFNVNGGSGSPVQEQIISFADAVSAQATITRTGYTLAGWNTQADGSGQSVADGAALGALVDAVDSSGNLTLYAQWTPTTSALTFNVNGGSGSMSTGKVATYGQAMPTPVNLPTRVGYAFTGFYDATSGGTKYYNADGTSARTWNKNKTSGTTLYAQWTPKTSELTFNVNGGSGTMTTGLVATYDAAMPTGLTLPTRTGYTFAGFYDATSGGTKYYNADGTSARTWNKDTTSGTTLYARWTPKTSALTFNVNGGSGTMSTGIVATYGQAMPTPVNLPTRVGYAFTGFYDATSGGTKYYNADGTSARTWNKNKTSGTTLYAQWTDATSALTFNANGGSGSMSTGKVATYGQAMPTPVNLPTRVGYAFTGFYDATSGGTKYYNADGTSARTWNKDTTSGTTLYAQWIKYATLYFYPNGGTGTMPTGLIAYKGQAMPTVAAANLPTKTGYIFTGFYTANLGGTKYYNADGTSAQNWDSDANTLQLFAQWHSTTMSVTFNPNGGTLAGNEFFRQLVLNDTYGTLPTPTRTGYRFLGWYTAASGGTKVTASTQRTVLADHILYAHWSANPSKIVLSFQPMGGTCQTRTKNCNVNAAYGTLPTPTRTGYTFDGWFTASSGGTQVSSATVAGTVNVTLYAHWTLTNPEPEPEPVAIDWWGIILS